MRNYVSAIARFGLVLGGVASATFLAVPVDASVRVESDSKDAYFTKTDDCEGRAGRFPMVLLIRTAVPEYSEGTSLLGPEVNSFFPNGELPPQQGLLQVDLSRLYPETGKTILAKMPNQIHLVVTEGKIDDEDEVFRGDAPAEFYSVERCR